MKPTWARWSVVLGMAIATGCGSGSAANDDSEDASASALHRDGGTSPQGRCPSGYTNCRGLCVITSADENNCGGCGIVCPGGWDCCNGTCRSPDSFQSDESSCGSCGHACGASSLCCGGSCVANNPSNCGSCGKSCAPDELWCGGTGRCGATCETATETCIVGQRCTTSGCKCFRGSVCGDHCVSCNGFAAPDPNQNCACACPITAADCTSDQTFDAEQCTCVCNNTLGTCFDNLNHKNLCCVSPAVCTIFTDGSAACITPP
ncbi:MAG: hypothetical protein ACXWVM_38935 [Polyangiales bacterium]